jgi:hypothetical protein
MVDTDPSATWHKSQALSVPTGSDDLRYSFHVGKDALDLATRLRIAARLREYMRENEIDDPEEVAKKMGPPTVRVTVVKLLNGTRTAGLDKVLLMHRGLGISYVKLLEKDPPREWFVVGSERPGSSATQSPAADQGPSHRGHG